MPSMDGIPNGAAREVQKTKPAPPKATPAPKAKEPATPAIPKDDVKVKTKTKLGEDVKLFDPPPNPKDGPGKVIYKSPNGATEISTYADDKGAGVTFKTKF